MLNDDMMFLVTTFLYWSKWSKGNNQAAEMKGSKKKSKACGNWLDRLDHQDQLLISNDFAVDHDLSKKITNHLSFSNARTHLQKLYVVFSKFASAYAVPFSNHAKRIAACNGGLP